MVAALRRAGIRYEFVHYADRGHMRLTDEVIREMLTFMAVLDKPQN